MRMYAPADDINELSGTVNVSVLTVLRAFTRLGTNYHTLLFTIQNTSVTDTLTMIVETSEDATYPDSALRWEISVAPNTQGSLEIGPGQIRNDWRLSAQTTSPAFPVVSAKWGIRGVHRAK